MISPSYRRNNENLIVGRHKRSVVDAKEFEHFQIVYGQDMADLLKLSEEVDQLEQILVNANGHSRRKRESVDHIGNVIMVCESFMVFFCLFGEMELEISFNH